MRNYLGSEILQMRIIGQRGKTGRYKGRPGARKAARRSFAETCRTALKVCLMREYAHERWRSARMERTAIVVSEGRPGMGLGKGMVIRRRCAALAC